MSVRWKQLRRDPLVRLSVGWGWSGLEAQVDGTPGTSLLRWLGAGPFHVGLFDGPRPLLLCALDEWWHEPSFLRGRFAPVVPPWAAEDVRAAPEDALSREWWDHWGKKVLSVLGGRLVEGPWWVLGRDVLAPVTEQVRWPGPPYPWLPMPPEVHGAERALDPRRAWMDPHAATVPGELLTLQRPIEGASSRLKWWRKVARFGVCPPGVCLYLPIYDRHVLVDGHVRLRAALEEGAPAPLLTLFTVFFRQEGGWSGDDPDNPMWSAFGEPATWPKWLVEHSNVALRLGAGEGRPSPVLRVRELAGGGRRWRELVQSCWERPGPREDDLLHGFLDLRPWPVRRPDG